MVGVRAPGAARRVGGHPVRPPGPPGRGLLFLAIVSAAQLAWIMSPSGLA
jgi:hypothetical protein